MSRLCEKCFCVDDCRCARMGARKRVVIPEPFMLAIVQPDKDVDLRNATATTMDGVCVQAIHVAKMEPPIGRVEVRRAGSEEPLFTAVRR